MTAREPCVGSREASRRGSVMHAVPRGVAVPPQRPGLADVDDTPRRLPRTIEMPDLDGIVPPAADLLADGK